MNEIQQRILEIYNEIKIICDRHHIPYFAIGGTCLGAVRHHGFIPWDDDLDIAIPIERYEQFLNLCSKELPDYLSVYKAEDKPHYLNIFCKIIDNRTAFIEKTIENHPESYWGIFVDIMPMSGLPTQNIKRSLFILWLRALLTLHSFRRREINDYKNKAGRRKYRAISIITNKFPQNWFVSEYYKTLKKYPVTSSKYVGYSWSKMLKKRIFSQKLFSDTVELQFENTTMKCPVGYDKFLSAMFGNYMEYPQEKDRISGHTGIINLNHSYMEYQELEEEENIQ